jgi:hypothetical protein
MEKLQMKRISRRGDMFEIAKDSTRSKRGKDFSIEHTFACMFTMMNSKTGNNCIKCSQSGEGHIQVLFQNLNRCILLKTRTSCLKHGRREIHPNGIRLGAIRFEQSDQSPITCPEIEETLEILRHNL